MSLHSERTHSTYVEGCFGCQISGVSFTGYRESLGRTRTERKRNEAELKQYRRARREGSQPRGTQEFQTQEAIRESDRLGRAFRADDLAGTYHPEIKEALIGAPPVSIATPKEDG